MRPFIHPLQKVHNILFSNIRKMMIKCIKCSARWDRAVKAEQVLMTPLQVMTQLTKNGCFLLKGRIRAETFGDDGPKLCEEHSIFVNARNAVLFLRHFFVACDI
jgi:hypothetical protein